MENFNIKIKEFDLNTNTQMFRVFYFYCCVVDNKEYIITSEIKGVKNGVKSINNKDKRLIEIFELLENKTLSELEISFSISFKNMLKNIDKEKEDKKAIVINTKDILKNVGSIKKVEVKTIEKIHDKQSTITDFTNNEIDVKPKLRDTSILLDDDELEEIEANKTSIKEEASISNLLKRKGGK